LSKEEWTCAHSPPKKNKIKFVRLERIIQARKFIACLNGILWSKDIRQERKLNIYNALIKSSILYGSETWRLMENNKRRVEATEMDALRRSSRISRKDRIRNVNIRQQIRLEEKL
jgi:hypothetical protein